MEVLSIYIRIPAKSFIGEEECFDAGTIARQSPPSYMSIAEVAIKGKECTHESDCYPAAAACNNCPFSDK